MVNGTVVGGNQIPMLRQKMRSLSCDLSAITLLEQKMTSLAGLKFRLACTKLL